MGGGVGDGLGFARCAFRRRLDRNRGVGKVVVGDESAIADVERDRDQHRNRESEAGQAGGDDVVGVARFEKEKRGVERVDGVMPDQKRQEAESEEQESEEHADETDFEAADEKRLIGIGGVPETPHESGNNY